VSSLPPGDLIPGPQMMSVSFSLAGLALAETREEKTDETAKLEKAADELRAGFAHLRKSCDEMIIANPTDHTELRSLLDKLIFVEKGLINVPKLLERLLLKEQLEANVAEKVRRFTKEINDEFKPFIRELRLQTICVIAERASVAGVPVIDVSDEFRKFFKEASVEETEGWQETAYILANIEGAKRLAHSIASDPETEDVLSAPTKEPPAH